MFIPNEFKHLILNTAPRHLVKAVAPSTFSELMSQPTLVVWNGASDATIWNDSAVNYAFRALHDALHLKTRIGFTPLEEIAIGRIQASQYESYSSYLADLVYIETAGQAEYFLKNGIFVQNQVAFTESMLLIK
jgi:hypothetical protein